MPPAVMTTLPSMTLAPRLRPLTSLRMTLLPLLMETIEKLLVLSRVIFPALAAKVAVPVTDNAPESAIAPLPVLADRVPVTVMAARSRAPAVVMVRLPPMVLAPRLRSLTSLRVTFVPLLMATVEKLLVLSRAIFAVPAVKIAVPAIDNAPESVIALLPVLAVILQAAQFMAILPRSSGPTVVIFRLPLMALTVMELRLSALLSLSVTLIPVALTDFLKSLARLRIISDCDASVALPSTAKPCSL